MAVEIAAPGIIRLVEEELPPPREGEVAVRTLYSGISSGTETLLYRGELPEGLVLDETLPSLARRLSYPVRYGYGCVGVVEGGAAHHGRLVFAFQPHQAGFVCRAGDVIPIDAVEPRVATLFPLVETALQVALDAGQVAGEHVVVVGLGAVGILSGALLARAGANVIASDPKRWRREAAEEFEIESVAPAELHGLVVGRTAGRGTPLVVEASGNPEALGASLPLLAHEGSALVVSWYGNKRVSLPLGLEFHRRRLKISSSQVSSIPAHLSGRWTVERRRAEVVRLMAELPLARLATHEFPVEQAARAFRAVADGTEGLVHAALRYD